MVYTFEITTPKNTLETAKQKTVCQLEKGIIKHFEVFFPPGPAGLLHIQIARGNYQIWPKNTDDSFAADDVTISFNDEFSLKEPPYQLEVYTWNDDDIYEHMTRIRFLIIPVKLGLVLASSTLEEVGEEI